MSRALVAVAGVALLVAGCGSERSDGQAGRERTVTVLAAASLGGVLDDVAARFEAANEGVTVEVATGGSSDLVAQLQGGAPGDVLALADERTMGLAVDDDLVAGEPTVLASNVLQVVTPPDDPAGVDGLADLAREGTQVVLCAPEVPCGAAAVRVEEAAGLDIRPVSEEQSVTDVLGKVTSGEADAGLVYVTDVIAAGDTVRGVAFPESVEAVNRYPVATLAGSREEDLAAELVAFLTGPEGRRLLDEAGFGPP